MISFIHLAKNLNAAEFGVYEDVILDACCQNIASADEIWYQVVEMSVLLVTCIQQSNPRSPWYASSPLDFFLLFFLMVRFFQQLTCELPSIIVSKSCEGTSSEET